jgi:hypothetical protein
MLQLRQRSRSMMLLLRSKLSTFRWRTLPKFGMASHDLAAKNGLRGSIPLHCYIIPQLNPLLYFLRSYQFDHCYMLHLSH